MKQSKISFTLQNTSSESDVIAVLIAAGLRRVGHLKGKFLAVNKFLDEQSGETVINVTASEPKNAISELDEYASQLDGIQVAGVLLETSNLAQGTLSLVEKTYVEFHDAVSKNIETDATLTVGTPGVMHTFHTPFVSGPMKNLEMKILKGETVRVTLFLSVPVGSPSAEQPHPDSNTHPVL